MTIASRLRSLSQVPGSALGPPYICGASGARPGPADVTALPALDFEPSAPTGFHNSHPPHALPFFLLTGIFLPVA